METEKKKRLGFSGYDKVFKCTGCDSKLKLKNVPKKGFFCCLCETVGRKYKLIPATLRLR